MIDAWWLMIPLMVMAVELKAIVILARKLKWEMSEHIETLNEFESCQKRLLSKAKDLTAIYTDIRDASNVHDAHGFIRARIEGRKQMKKKEKS